MNRLASQIKEARIKAKLTEKELAQKAGIQLNYLLQVESGKKVVNEATAQILLDILGQEMNFMSIDEVEKEKEVLKEKPIVKKVVIEPVSPSSQWTDILSGVIKKYPVLLEGTDKEVGTKEHVITSKKIDGIHFEKLLYLQIATDDLTMMRIHRGDVAQFQQINAIENNKVYYFSVKNAQKIRLLRIEKGNQVYAFKHFNDKAPEIYDLREVNIIGKLNKIEFYLS